MIKHIKKLSTIGLILILVGGVLFTVAFAASGFNFSNLSGVKLVEKIEALRGDTEKLTINTGTTDVRIEFSATAEEISVKYYEKQKKNGEPLKSLVITSAEKTATIKEKVDFDSYLTFWDFKNTTMTVTIPESLKTELKVVTDTGDITVIGNASFTSAYFEVDTGDINTERAIIKADSRLQFEVDTGDVDLGKFDTASLFVEADTGDVTLSDGNATEKINIEADTGDVEFNGIVKTKSIYVKLDTGDVESKKSALINAESTTIVTDTGDVTLKMSGAKGDYGIIIKTHTGHSNISNQLGGDKMLNVKTDTGDIKISFAG